MAISETRSCVLAFRNSRVRTSSRHSSVSQVTSTDSALSGMATSASGAMSRVLPLGDPVPARYRTDGYRRAGSGSRGAVLVDAAGHDESSPDVSGQQGDAGGAPRPLNRLPGIA